MDTEGIPTLVLVRDLIFAAKILQTAQALDLPVTLIRSPGQLTGQTGRQLLVDLNLPGALEAAIQWQAVHDRRAIGFVSHVDAATIARAHEKGLAQVLARSRFVEMLPDLLAVPQ